VTVKVLVALVVILLIGFFGGIVSVVMGQGGGLFIRVDCTTITTPVTGASFCLQIGVPPSFQYWNGTAWAHYGYEDTTGTTVVLDTLNETAVVAVAGQRAAVVTVPASVTLNGIFTPIVSSNGGSTYLATDHSGNAIAAFVDGAGNRLTTLTFPLSVPTNPVALRIESFVPATHIGVRVSTYTSGSASTTLRAMSFDTNRSLIGMGGSDGAAIVPQKITNIGGVNAAEVAIAHALATYSHLRSTSATFDGVNDEAAIAGGAGQICFEIPSGGTGTVAFEARVASGSWVAEPTVFYSGGASSFPARGCFTRTGLSEYRIRASVWSAGSVTAVILVSPGAPYPSDVTLSAGANVIGHVALVATATTTNATATCYLAATASTNSTSCKGAAGNVYGLRATNTTSTPYYLRLYNSASAPTCSSATGFVESVLIPANTLGSGVVESRPVGSAFSTGIGFCITGGASSTDNTNAADGVLVAVRYK
jgi:hypothetical protein